MSVRGTGVWISAMLAGVFLVFLGRILEPCTFTDILLAKERCNEGGSLIIYIGLVPLLMGVLLLLVKYISPTRSCALSKATKAITLVALAIVLSLFAMASAYDPLSRDQIFNPDNYYLKEDLEAKHGPRSQWGEYWTAVRAGQAEKDESWCENIVNEQTFRSGDENILYSVNELRHFCREEIAQ